MPFAFLGALWATWVAGGTADGDPAVRVAVIVIAVALAVTGAVMTWSGRRAAAIATGIALMAAGAGALRGAAATRDTGQTSLVVPGIVAVRATIDGDPEWRGATQLVPVRVEAVAWGHGRWEIADGRATMRAPVDVEVSRGDVVEAAPSSISQTTFGTREVRRLATAVPANDPDAATTARRRLAAPIEAWFPEPEAALATGVLLGDRSGVPAQVRRDFNATGAAHLVAISGWNVALVATAIGWLMTRGRARRRFPWQVARAVVTSAALWAFVALVGASGSVLRAAVMAQIGLAARMTGGRASVAGTLPWSAVAIAGTDPATLDDVGWQLSFLGAVGLVWLSPWIAARLAPPAGAWWRWLLPSGVREAVAAAIAAQACVLPVLAGTLGSVPLLGVAATTPGLLLVPSLMLASAALVVADLLMGSWPAVAAWVLPAVATAAWAPTTLLVRLVGWAATLPGASTTSPSWHPVAVGAYLAGLAVLVAVAESMPRPRRPGSRRDLPAGRVAAFAMVAAAIALVAVPAADAARAGGASSRPPGTPPVVAHGGGPPVRVVVPALEGHVDGTVVAVSVPGGPRMLVGGGPTAEAGARALGPTLRPWDRAVDAIILTAPDASSLAGFRRVLARYPVGAVIDLTAGATAGLLPGIRARATAGGVALTAPGNGAPVFVGDAARANGGPCPATATGAAVVLPVGPPPPRLGSGRTGPTSWPAVAVRVCAGWADVTVVPEVSTAAAWLAHAASNDARALVATSGRPRWLVVPWRDWRSGDLDAIRAAVRPSLTVVQGAPEPWRSPPTRPAATGGEWWVTAIDGPLDLGDAR